MVENYYREDAVAFLDVDGILIHDLSTRRHGQNPKKYPTEMDPRCVEFLVTLQEKYRFKLVMSSSMRITFKTIEAFKERYAAAGADKLVFHEDWRTPSFTEVYEGSERALKKWCNAMSVEPTIESTKHWRGHQVMKWLADHPGVTNYLAIDDSPDFYPLEEEQCLHIRYGLSEGGLAHGRHDLIDAAFERNFQTADQQRLIEGQQILDALMKGYKPDAEWMKKYSEFRDAAEIVAKRDLANATDDEMYILRTVVQRNPALLIMVAGMYKYQLNFVASED